MAKIEEKDRKKYTKIAFTDIPSQEVEQNNSLGAIRSEILKDLSLTDRPITPDLNTNSDTESQGHGPIGISVDLQVSLPVLKPSVMATTSSPRPTSPPPPEPLCEISTVDVTSPFDPHISSQNIDIDLINENTETQKEQIDSFSRLFSEEMKDDDIQLPWLDRPAEKRQLEVASVQLIAARHREGFLQRKGDWTGFWRRRYFKLFNHKLTYYRSDTDESAAQVLPISAMSDVVEEVIFQYYHIIIVTARLGKS